MAKKVTIKELTERVNEVLVDDVDRQWRGLEIHIKKQIGVADMLDFVNTVVAWCIDEDTGEYRPEWRAFSYRLEIVEKYTNLTLPKDLDKQYHILLCNDLIDMIVNSVNFSQLTDIEDAIDDKISYIRQSSSSATYKQMSDVVNAFSQMQDVANEMFTKENVATLNQFMETVNNIDAVRDKAVKLYEVTDNSGKEV